MSARRVGAEGVEPSSRSYKEHALTVELRAVPCIAVSEVEGSRTLTIPLKRRKRYRYATTSIAVDRGVCVSEVVHRA
jgi:hypothetical protein